MTDKSDERSKRYIMIKKESSSTQFQFYFFEIIEGLLYILYCENSAVLSFKKLKRRWFIRGTDLFWDQMNFLQFQFKIKMNWFVNHILLKIKYLTVLYVFNVLQFPIIVDL